MAQHSDDLITLNQLKNRLKDSETIIKLFDKNKVDLKIINWIPMRFSDNLDVSARTQHGIITFNGRLRQRPDDLDMYGAHEITHVLDQCFSDKPTQGAVNDEDYLSNKHEQKAFREQTKFITEKDGPSAAEDYIEKVLKHHEVPKKEWDEKKDDLLRTASKQMKLDFYNEEKKKPADISKIDEFLEKLETGNLGEITPRYIPNTKIPEIEKQYRLKKLRNILDILEKKAGLLEIPIGFPIEEVNQWLGQVTASRVNANIEEFLFYIKQQKKLYQQAQHNLNTIKNFYFEDGGTLNLDDDNIFEVKKIKDDQYYLNANGKIYNSLSYDDIEKILWGPSGELTTLVSVFENLIADEELNKNEDNSRIIEAQLLHKYLKKYPLSSNSKRATKEIDFNNQIIRITYGNSWQNLNMTPTDFGGLFLFKNNKYNIYIVNDPISIMTIKDFDLALESVKQILKHELRHLNQDKLNPEGLGGLPPKSLRNEVGLQEKLPYQNDSKESLLNYYLDDTEFYTLLADKIEFFKKTYNNVPQDVKLEIFKAIVGLPFKMPKNKSFYKKYVQPNNFFLTLKEYNPDKWQKAIKEFWKAINE